VGEQTGRHGVPAATHVRAGTVGARSTAREILEPSAHRQRTGAAGASSLRGELTL